jgi:hypothetical protein
MDSIAASALISALSHLQSLAWDAGLNNVNVKEAPIESTPQSGLITLESLRAAAKAVGLSEEGYQLRVSTVSADSTRASVRKDGVGSEESVQGIECTVLIL